MSITFRQETPEDARAIESLTASAFLNAPYAAHTEQFIINALRRTGKLSISIVAEKDGAIIGHVAVSPVFIHGNSHGNWYGIGPVSVAPEWQRQKIGSLLMHEAISEMRRIGAAGCVLVGDPNFYNRFGFQSLPTLIMPGVPPENLMAISFNEEIPSGIVVFDEAFNAKN